MKFWRAKNRHGSVPTRKPDTGAPQKQLRDKLPSWIAGLAVPAVLATLAFVNPGVTISELELNDGTVWITNTQELKAGRYNATIKELNGGVVAPTTRFDVLQDEQDTLVVDSTTISKVDPATTSYAVIAQIPAQSQVSMAQGTIAITAPDGRLWITTTQALDNITDTTAVAQDLSDGAVATVGRDGRVYAFDPGTGDVLTMTAEDPTNATRVPLKGAAGLALSTEEAKRPTLTVVGSQPVMLANNILYGEHFTTDLTQYGNQPALQYASTTRGEVIVASDRSLLAINLSSGATEQLIGEVNGAPAKPVYLDGCVYGAWASTTENYVQLCGPRSSQASTTAQDVQSIEDVSSTSVLVFRVNRDVVLLNDAKAGRVWVPENMPKSEEPNWKDVQAPDNQDTETDNSNEQEAQLSDSSQCNNTERPPRARDDEFGVRAGRSTILNTLTNDSAGQCGIIAITEITEIPSEFGTVQLIDNGRALQTEVRPSATGSVTFTYTISDGRGQNAPSSATVTLTAHPDTTNSAPHEDRVARAEVEQGATLNYNALANFTDPDGDQLVLMGATLTEGTGTVRFRKDGMVTYVADSQALGVQKLGLTVSDGQESVETQLLIDVRSVGSIAPTIRPIHRVAYVSSPVEVNVLEAVKSYSTESVRLAAVEELAGTEISGDLENGTFTFSAPTPGNYYVAVTVVSSPHTITGLVRIDVREWPETPLPPVAVSDVALLPVGGEVTVAPLSNDYDPNGGVMVLTGIELEDNSKLSVGVIEHRYVKIESRVALTTPEVIRYVVDNGVSTASGTILVQPVEPSTEQRAPSVKPITVSVRTGGVVSIPVLDYASDADGDTLSLVKTLPEPLANGEGLLFVSGDVLRYQAPAQPRSTTTTFEVTDPAGNIAVGTLTVNVHQSNADSKAPPKPKRITARAYAGETIRIPIPLTGIDQDGDGVSLLGLADQLPTQGAVFTVGADWLEYTADSTARGTDTFTYAVEDWTGQRAVGTIRVGVVEKPLKSLPIVASDDYVEVQPGTTVEVRVTKNDVDPSGLELLVDDLVPVDGIDATVQSNRIVVHVPKDAREPLVIPYTVRNVAGVVAHAVLRVDVSEEALIAPPTVNDIVVAPTEVINKTSAEVDVFAVAENPSGPVSELELTVPSSHSHVASVSGTGKVTIQLGETAATVPFKLTNPREPENAYTYAFISVPALGDFPPVLRPKPRALEVASGGELIIPLAEFVQVGSGKEPFIQDASTVRSQQADSSVLVKSNKELRFVSKKGFVGTASLSFEVWDSESGPGNSSILTLPISVYAEENYPPSFVPSIIQVPQGNEPVGVDLAQFTKMAPGTTLQDLQFKLAGAPTHGLSVNLTQSTLTLRAPVSVARGTRGEISLSLLYGLTGQMTVVVPFEVIASTKQLPVVNDHSVLANAGETTRIPALQGAVDPVGAGLTIIDAQVLTANTGTVHFTGSNVEVTPANDFAGTMKIAYTVKDALNDPNRNVDGTINVTVRKVPDAPLTPRVSEPANKSVTVSWEPPASNGAPITSYRVTAMPGGQTKNCQSTTCVFSGLTNGTAYRFTVAATNEVGYSAESAPSNEITPDVLPAAPGRPVLEYGDATVKATWTAPTNEGTGIKHYLVEIAPGVDGVGTTIKEETGTSATFTRLKNGTAYTVRVRAVNSALVDDGKGPWSPVSDPMIPAGPPEAPTVTARLPEDTPLGRQIAVNWKPGKSNGDPISGYTVNVLNGATVVATKSFDIATTSWTFTEAENGLDYRFQVSARNKAGESAPGVSEPISSFTRPSVPQTVDSANVDGRDYAQGGALRLTWTPPESTGGRGIRISHYEVKDQSATVSGTTLIVEGLTAGQFSGDYQVRAWNDRGVASSWMTIPGSTPHTRPQSPEVSRQQSVSYRDYKFTVLPRNNGGLADVTYQYRLNGGEWATLPASKSVSGSVTEFGAAQSKDVVFEARAVNAMGESGSSQTMTTIVKPQAPLAPTGISATVTAEAPYTVSASWQAPAERGLTIIKYGYCVVGKNSNAPCNDSPNNQQVGKIFYTAGSDERSFTQFSVPQGTEYTLRVWAVVQDSQGVQSNGSTGTTTFVVPVEPEPEPTPDPEPEPSTETSTAGTG